VDAFTFELHVIQTEYIVWIFNIIHDNEIGKSSVFKLQVIDSFSIDKMFTLIKEQTHFICPHIIMFLPYSHIYINTMVFQSSDYPPVSQLASKPQGGGGGVGGLRVGGRGRMRRSMISGRMRSLFYIT
jgi:hypothetical protein